MIDWDKLRIFHAVAHAGSFTRAGHTLGIGQSSVSRQIGGLEDRLQIPLFHRHARGLILTEEGELLHNATKDIFARLSAIESKLADTRDLAEGPLRITVAEFVGTTWLAPKLHIFDRMYPDLQLTVLMTDKVLNLNLRQADAAIRLHKPEQQDLIQRHLARVNFRIAASPIYLANRGEPKTLDELKSHTLLGYPEDIHPPFPDPNWLFRVASVSPDSDNNPILMNSLSGIERAVEKGAGIAILPDYLIRANKDIDIIMPDEHPPTADMYFVYPEDRRNSRRISAFKDFLLENIREFEK